MHAGRMFLRPLLLSGLFVSLAPAVCAAEKSHLDFQAEARAAYGNRDFAAAQAATVAALALRPDSPRYLHNLAALQSLAGDAAGALSTLRRLAALGVAPPIERDPDFAALQGSPSFRTVSQLFAANREPLGQADVVAELTGRAGILECIAFRERTGDTFLGDAHLRGIWRRDRTGKITRFSEEDEDLFGIFGLALDEPRRVLWAAMMAGPEMTGYTKEMKGQSGLAEFSLVTGELRRVIDLPDDNREHGLSDLTVAPDGTVYATDSRAPIIWKLAPGAEAPEPVVEFHGFSSLQGILLHERTLIVSDFANGLFHVDLTTSTVTPLAAPKDTTLLGLDGLVPAPGGLVAIQNGVTPQRVLLIRLNPEHDRITGVTVLARSLPHLDDLSLVTLVNGRPTVIAGAGWDLFDPQKAKAPPSHTVRLLQVALP